jgi:hypothetical protein
MAHVSPLVHGRMAVNGVKAALRNWMSPRMPIASAPPKITAKEALLIARAAVADGQSVDEKAFAHAG